MFMNNLFKDKLIFIKKNQKKNHKYKNLKYNELFE